jgi:hypothetical protein
MMVPDFGVNGLLGVRASERAQHLPVAMHGVGFPSQDAS